MVLPIEQQAETWKQYQQALEEDPITHEEIAKMAGISSERLSTDYQKVGQSLHIPILPEADNQAELY